LFKILAFFMGLVKRLRGWCFQGPARSSW